MSIQDSEQLLAESAALAKPASVIIDKFSNNAVGDDPIVTRGGIIKSLAQIAHDLEGSFGGGASKVYDSVVNGLSGTQDKEIFVVADGTGIYQIYQNNQAASLLLGNISVENYSTAEKTKLGGIAAQATKNSTDSQLRDRSTHTGTQNTDTISGLDSALQSLNTGQTNLQTSVTTINNTLVGLKTVKVTTATHTVPVATADVGDRSFLYGPLVTSVILPTVASMSANPNGLYVLNKDVAATIVVTVSGGGTIQTETKGNDTSLNWNINVPLVFYIKGSNWVLQGI